MRFKLKIVFYWLKNIFAKKLKSQKEVADFQRKQLHKFANKVLRKSKFYSKYFVENQFDWSLVPEISKTDFMHHFDEINTKGILLNHAMKVALDAENSRDFKSEINGITVGLSTGTSGKRGIFLVSENERAKWVALVMSRVIKPKLFKKQKVAFFLRANSNLYSSVESSLFEFQYFDIFKPLPQLLIELNIYKPDILASQPSVLIDIAIAQKQKEILISPIQIISFAEVLHDSDKQLIEEIFESKITEIYQCTEGFLGVSCSHGVMHLNEDFVQFEKEWIDEDKFFPIITDFSRESQPVVKYKMNDILQIRKTPCSCGSHLLAIEKIIGRDDDVLIFNNTKIYPDLISRRIAQNTDSYTKYTIVQSSENCLEIGIECNSLDFEKTKIQFINAISQYLKEFEIENIEYVCTNKIEYISGNKNRKIRRMI